MARKRTPSTASASSATAGEYLVAISEDMFSEESDFHGSTETKALYNQLAKSYNPKEYWAIHDWNAQVIAANGRKVLEKAGKLRSQQRGKERDEVDVKSGFDSMPEDEDGDTNMSMIDTPPTSPSTKDAAKPQNYYEGHRSAKQLHETVPEFLTRLPPSTTIYIHAQDHWIWICNPFPSVPRNTTPESLPTFKQLGTRLLENFLAHKAELEAENPMKQAGSITRMLKPARDTLETSIRDLALANGITSGKWMLFPSTGTVDRVWEIVANAVWEGKLGSIAKVATAEPASTSETAFDHAFADGENTGAARSVRDQGQRLICIYTSDFTDKEDIQRVLRAIKDLGLINIDGVAIGATGTAGSLKQIYYKCDAYTYLDISGGNQYKLKASMYSSKDMFPGGYPEGSTRGGRDGGGYRRRS
ncbi:hypothetical protein H2200_004631 [Cladophialophora chaetospira]|uniref:Uncharacterized protein n=1 Tax=Cladophialophora chaetospira TaxID=386627 RepID=A0AA39CJN1_9EURO|nr:hypothetical protein H2200_004631 [Cladophialophora chaetospira]